MVKATLNGVVIAESDKTVSVDGNHYFPPSALKREYVQDSATHTTCSWKGVASYYTINVDGKSVSDGAWYYPAPKPAAENIKDHVAFYKNKFEIA